MAASLTPPPLSSSLSAALSSSSSTSASSITPQTASDAPVERRRRGRFLLGREDRAVQCLAWLPSSPGCKERPWSYHLPTRSPRLTHPPSPCPSLLPTSSPRCPPASPTYFLPPMS